MTSSARSPAPPPTAGSGSRPASRDVATATQVEYLVSDGRSAPVKETLTFDVQEPQDQETFPPIAEPDVVRGEEGQPIKIRPLLNDLPGSDPGNPNAELMLGGKIPAQPGATIETDLETGQLIRSPATSPAPTSSSTTPRYGSARLDPETMRIDVRPRPKRAGDPIAMPDKLTVFGQAPGIVDVLANDLDPAGGLLVVQRATADNRTRSTSRSSTVAGCASPRVRATCRPDPQLVHYTISNGSISGIEGEVSVTQRPAPADNSPVTTPDRVHVRAGASVTAPVLDNDIAAVGRSAVTGRRRGPGRAWPARDRPRCRRQGRRRHGVRLRPQRPLHRAGPQGARLLRRPLHRPTSTASAGRTPAVVVTPAKDPNTRPSRRRSRGASSRVASSR